jgi:hypothetical protein
MRIARDGRSRAAQFSQRNDLLDRVSTTAWPRPPNEQQRQQIYNAVMRTIRSRRFVRRFRKITWPLLNGSTFSAMSSASARLDGCGSVIELGSFC